MIEPRTIAARVVEERMVGTRVVDAQPHERRLPLLPAVLLIA